MSRRLPLAALLCLLVSVPSSAQPVFESAWSTADRVWAGPEYWANRLQDWQIRDGKLVCIARKAYRTVHLLTRRLGSHQGTLHMELDAAFRGASPEGSVGFLVGAGASDLDYRAASLVHARTGANGGYYAGLDRLGGLVIADHQGNDRVVLDSLHLGESLSAASLVLDLDEQGKLTLQAVGTIDGAVLGRVSAPLAEGDLAGNLALVAHRTRASFSRWTASGTRLEQHPDRVFGPIASVRYTISEGILTASAQFMPLSASENHIARFQILEGGEWIDLAVDDVAHPAYVAVFRVAGWDETWEAHYRVLYRLALPDGTEKEFSWEGIIRANPVDGDAFVMAAFTGNHNTWQGMEGRGDYAFDKAHLWFPHSSVDEDVRKHDPDLLFFSGDQVYEGASPTAADRDHIKRDYLYKWYLFCWAYGDLAGSLPSVVIPDDHDVYQGNIWGEGGRATDKDDKGGYVHDADFVRMVEKTQTANLPPPFDPRPIDQGIGVYFTNLKYGGIGLAVIEDRKFKSGPNGRVDAGQTRRADHIDNPDFDPALADVPGVTLLGERQLAFLESWARDWQNESMKAVLSQTVFANMATHHGSNLFRLWGDMDSNGWPQSGRNRALAAIRRGFALMIAGDQHLSTVVHHGIDNHGDAGISFAVPSIANFYPRAWSPEQPGKNRPSGAPPELGEHRDGFGNLVTVLAVENPPGFTGISTGIEPLLLNDRAPGYGIVRFDKTQRTITLENWPRYVDPSAPDARQYPGWPITLSQMDNYAREAAGHLATLVIDGPADPVVAILDEQSGEVVYSLRIQGRRFAPKVFDTSGSYTLRIGYPESDTFQEFHGLKAGDDPAELHVSF